MTIYQCVYDGKRTVRTLNREKMKPLGRTKSFTEGGCGTIYNNPFYATEEDAWKAWNGDFIPTERLIYL